MSTRKGNVVDTFTRRERGVSIPVVARKITLPDGNIAVEHAINLAGAEVPDRTYVAAACGVTFEQSSLRIMFAQPKLGGGLRSLVIINMSPLGASQFLASLDALKSPSIDDIATMTNLPTEALSPFPTEEPEQTVEFTSNMVGAAFSGYDACLDFYLASAYSMVAVVTTNKLSLEPVVRVNTRTSLILSLFHRMKELRNSFERDVIASQEVPHG